MSKKLFTREEVDKEVEAVLNARATYSKHVTEDHFSLERLEQVIENLLIRIGIDIQNPIEEQKDRAFLRYTRTLLQSAVTKTFIGLIIAISGIAGSVLLSAAF